MKWFWNNVWKFSKSTKRRKSRHFLETPGIKPGLDQYSHGGQRGKTLLAWARRLGHKYVNTFPVEAGGLHHRVISCWVFWIMILPASLVLETTMTYSFGTSSHPLHHAVNANKKVKNSAEFGRPSVKINARFSTERARWRKARNEACLATVVWLAMG